MLPKARRLTSEEVEEVLKKGTPLHTPPQKGSKSLVSAKFLAKGTVFKAVAIVPKTVAKRATERNRLRRAVYRAIASLPIPKKPGVATFFVRSIPKPPLSPAFAEEIKSIVSKL
jgi:ribonuclease P protein component